MIGSYTKHQRTPKRQPKQCNNSWIVYPSGITTVDLSLVQTRHKRWCTLDNRAAGKPVPAVTFDGAVVERTSLLRYLGIHFDRILTCNKHVETTTPKFKKGLSVPKAMAAKGIEQCHLFLLYRSVVLSVTDYTDQASQQWHRKICWSWTECRTRQCRSYSEPPRTHPLKPWGSC